MTEEACEAQTFSAWIASSADFLIANVVFSPEQTLVNPTNAYFLYAINVSCRLYVRIQSIALQPCTVVCDKTLSQYILRQVSNDSEVPAAPLSRATTPRFLAELETPFPARKTSTFSKDRLKRHTTGHGRHGLASRPVRGKEGQMATLERWSQTVGKQRGAPAPITLLTLFARYLLDLRYSDDGSLKTRRYLRESKKRAKYLLAWYRKKFGYHVEAERITIAHAKDYARARREGFPIGRSVRTRTLQADLKFLKGALNWGTRADYHGEPLIARNRLAGWVIRREQDVRRPIIDDETILRLRLVAPRVHRLLPLLILLMETTGRRLSSVLGLTWADFDFDKRLIRWRGELDKKRKTWDAPMPERAAEALLAHRPPNQESARALVFPHPQNPAVAVSRHLAADWLKRAYRYAGVEREIGGLWHPFRRRWATLRKHFSVKDIAAAGGWKDTQTILTCYIHADMDTMREVMEGPGGSRQRVGGATDTQTGTTPTKQKAQRSLASKASNHHAF